MTVNQSIQVVNGFKELGSALTQLANALDNIETVKETLDGITLSNFIADIEGESTLGHCDANTYIYLLTDVIPVGLVAALKAYYSGTPTQQGWAALMKARKL
jgi:hypothetical protein